jgi:hypothetical protein
MMQIDRPLYIVSHFNFGILCAQTMGELPLHVSHAQSFPDSALSTEFRVMGLLDLTGGA